MKKTMRILLLVGVMLVGMVLLPLSAEARQHCWWDKHHKKHCDKGHHKGWSKVYPDDTPLLDFKTRQILKGGLVGAGIGAGAGVILDRPVAKTSVIGAGVGSGVQAVKYSSYLNRHPVVKTAAYGALAGVGASQLNPESSVQKSALWGAAIGTGVGLVKNSE